MYNPMTPVETQSLSGNQTQNEGKALTDLQLQVADMLLSNEGITPAEIADHLGCSKPAVYKILQKQHVRSYILQHTHTMLLASASQAMATQRSLLNAKSEYVRHQAASDLLNRNEIGNSGIQLGQAVQVKIDLS